LAATDSQKLVVGHKLLRLSIARILDHQGRGSKGDEALHSALSPERPPEDPNEASASGSVMSMHLYGRYYQFRRSEFPAYAECNDALWRMVNSSDSEQPLPLGNSIIAQIQALADQALSL